MKKILIMLVLAAIHFAVYAQNVVQGEYFIDADKGFGNNAIFSVTPSAEGSFPFSASLQGIVAGYHTLFIRTKDSNGKWSLTARKNIQVLSTNINTITNGEYFFDDDPGFGNGNTISITKQDSVILQIFTSSLTGLKAGYHIMFMRLKNAEGNWGITSRYNMQVVADTTGGKVFMVEYFFDKDPGFGNCASFVFAKAASDGTFTFTIPQNNIPANPGTLYLRVKDSANYNWSLTSWESYSVLPLTLLSFTAQKQDANALLQWQSTHEVNIDHFNVQRSTNATSFSTIGKVVSKGSNYGGLNNYAYADNISALPAGNVFYRLQIVDKDGKFSYSKIEIINIDGNIKFSVTPNPANNYCYIKTDGNINLQSATIAINDLFGRQLSKQKLNSNNYKLNLSNVAKGTYLINITSSNFSATQKLIVQ